MSYQMKCSVWDPKQVGYLPDGTPMNRAGNAVNHPENIQPDPHAPGMRSCYLTSLKNMSNIQRDQLDQFFRYLTDLNSTFKKGPHDPCEDLHCLAPSL